MSEKNESKNDSQNSGRNLIEETAQEAWGLYVQYRRTINEATKYWENEISAGLSTGKYTNSMDKKNITTEYTEFHGGKGNTNCF